LIPRCCWKGLADVFFQATGKVEEKCGKLAAIDPQKERLYHQV